MGGPKKFIGKTKAEEVIPNADWRFATGADIKVGDGYDNVTIFRSPRYLLEMTVRIYQFPRGVLIINPYFVANPSNENGFFGTITSSENLKEVPTDWDEDDPSGIFVLFK
jgi:hypothetical protein